MDQAKHSQAPGPSRPQQGQQPGRQAGQHERGSRSKLWVLDGRIYNYNKPGATQVSHVACRAHAGSTSELWVHALGWSCAGCPKGCQTLHTRCSFWQPS